MCLQKEWAEKDKEEQKEEEDRGGEGRGGGGGGKNDYFRAVGRSGAFFYDRDTFVFATTWHRDLLTSIFYIQDGAIYHQAKAPAP